jgi:hypothetical protein
MFIVPAGRPIQAKFTGRITLRHLRRLEPDIAPLLIARAARLRDYLSALILAAHHTAIIVACVLRAGIAHLYSTIVSRDGWLITSTAGALALRPAGPRGAYLDHITAVVALVPYQLADLAIAGGPYEVLHREVAPIDRGDFFEVSQESYVHNFCLSYFLSPDSPGGFGLVFAFPFVFNRRVGNAGS